MHTGQKHWLIIWDYIICDIAHNMWYYHRYILDIKIIAGTVQFPRHEKNGHKAVEDSRNRQKDGLNRLMGIVKNIRESKDFKSRSCLYGRLGFLKHHQLISDHNKSLEDKMVHWSQYYYSSRTINVTYSQTNTTIQDRPDVMNESCNFREVLR